MGPCEGAGRWVTHGAGLRVRGGSVRPGPRAW